MGKVGIKLRDTDNSSSLSAVVNVQIALSKHQSQVEHISFCPPLCFLLGSMWSCVWYFICKCNIIRSDLFIQYERGKVRLIYSILDGYAFIHFLVIKKLILWFNVLPQFYHKGAPRHNQSPWKRLFGLHRASQRKHTFIPVCLFLYTAVLLHPILINT